MTSYNKTLKLVITCFAFSFSYSLPMLLPTISLADAIIHKHPPETIQFLLDSGANQSINLQDQCGLTALMYAIIHKYPPQTIKLLLDSGANQGINLQDKYGKTALMYALIYKHPQKTIPFLLDSGASSSNIEYGCPPDPRTPGDFDCRW